MSTKPPTLYPPQNPMALGNHYLRHIAAMTAEGLHLKSAIAEQLAWRDRRIEELEKFIHDYVVAVTMVMKAYSGDAVLLDPAIAEMERLEEIGFNRGYWK